MSAPAAVIALLFAAASLGKFQHWAGTPQSYFMTQSERAEWARVTTEDEAARFVDRFLAARGPRFAAEVDARAREADENLTVAGKRGSQTLRGKIGIVLGRPSSVTIVPWSGDKSATMADHAVTVRPHPVMNVPPGAPPASEMRKRYSVDYKLAYPKRTIVVAVDPATGEDRILDARAAREVGELLEAAAAASQKPSR